jgi:hypothetical protein
VIVNRADAVDLRNQARIRRRLRPLARRQQRKQDRDDAGSHFNPLPLTR